MEDFIQSLEAIEVMDMVESERLFSRPRLYRERPVFFYKYDDHDFFIRYRLSKESVIYLLERIEHYLEYPDNRNKSVSPINQLLCTLRFFATGNHLLAVADNGGISVATCSRIVKKVSKAIITLREEFIKFPDDQEERSKVKKEFYKIARFPNVLGCIDCTQSPGEDAEIFRNRKFYMYINVQTISLPNLLTADVVARWPGSTHDSSIYHNSRRYARFERGDYPGEYLLGDSGYPLKRHLNPYLNPITLGQRKYNESTYKNSECS